MPPVLFKYVTASTALRVLEDRRLRWSDPTVFNDVLEFQRSIKFKPSVKTAMRLRAKALVNAALGTESLCEEKLLDKGSALEGIRELLRRGEPPDELVTLLIHPEKQPDHRVSETVKSIYAMLLAHRPRVLCFSELWSNDAMWAHYAGNFTGFVLGFRQPFHSNGDSWTCERVRYSDGPIYLGSGLDFLLYGTAGLKVTEALLYIKSRAWSYEREWRAITFHPNAVGKLYGDYEFNAEDLESIVLGPRATAEDIRAVVDIISRDYDSCQVFALHHIQTKPYRIAYRPHA